MAGTRLTTKWHPIYFGVQFALIRYVKAKSQIHGGMRAGKPHVLFDTRQQAQEVADELNQALKEAA